MSLKSSVARTRFDESELASDAMALGVTQRLNRQPLRSGHGQRHGHRPLPLVHRHDPASGQLGEGGDESALALRLHEGKAALLVEHLG